MSGLFEQLKRRNVFRAAATYVGLSWILLQVVDLISPILGLPDSIMRGLAIVLLLGFIPAIIVSWLYEITPEGLKKESEIDESSAHRQHVARKMNMTVIVLLVIAIGLLALDRYFLPETVQQAGEEQTADAPADDGRIDSIAVLPFADFSATGDQAYLGDGIADTVLHMLAGVPGLRVAARTSSFRFRGENADITTIGQQLNVKSVLEGSVQVAGDQLRIIAQLVRTSDQSHIWSHTFDRDKADIFAIQDEIANAVVAEFSGDEEAAPGIQSLRTTPEVYAKVLQARQLARNRSAADIESAIGLLNEAIALDTTYAPAHSEMAGALVFSTMYGTGNLETLRPRIEAEIATALQLDSRDGTAYAIRAVISDDIDQFDQARADYERALELNPSDVETMTWLGEHLTSSGDLRGARQWYQRAYETDPLNVRARAEYSRFLIEVDQDVETAIAVGEETVALGLNPKMAQLSLAVLYMRVSRLADVTRAFFNAARLDPESPDVYKIVASWLAFMGDRELALSWRELAIEMNPEYAHSQDFLVRRFFGEEEQLLAELEAGLAENPDSLTALTDVSYTAAQIGHFERALAVGEEFSALKPEPGKVNPSSLMFQSFAMAIMYRRTGRQEESRFYVQMMEGILQKMREKPGVDNALTEFLQYLLACARGDFDTVADRIEGLEVGKPIVYQNIRYNALWSDSHDHPRIKAWLDEYEALIRREREEIQKIDDPAWRNPRLLLAADGVVES